MFKNYKEIRRLLPDVLCPSADIVRDNPFEPYRFDWKMNQDLRQFNLYMAILRRILAKNGRRINDVHKRNYYLWSLFKLWMMDHSDQLMIIANDIGFTDEQIHEIMNPQPKRPRKRINLDNYSRVVFEIEKFMDIKKINDKTHIFVKWKDHDESYDSWEPIDGLMYFQPDMVREYLESLVFNGANTYKT
jgi:hypothetical protein